MHREEVPQSWRQTWQMLQTRLGRLRLGLFLVRRSEPGWYRCAQAYRATLLRRARLAVVVGSFGKTTTTRAVTAALGGDVARLFERNAGFSLARAVLRLPPWTRVAAIEVGVSRLGQMRRSMAMIQPNIAIVTCIGSEHRRTFKTLEVTRDQKAEAVRCLPASGLAVLNGDDPHVRWMRGQTSARVITYGFEAGNDFRLTEARAAGFEGTQLRIVGPSGSRWVRSRLIGRHMAYPIAAAVATAVAEGWDLARALRGLQSLTPTPGRMQLVSLPNGVRLLRDDYKASLETIDAALDALAELPARRKIIVLGEVSEPPPSQGPIYRRLGQRVGGIATQVVLLANGKNRQPFRAGLNLAGFPREQLIYQGHDVLRAIEILRDALRADDVVLIKGRDTQRLERVAFGLQGRDVRCARSDCRLTAARCAHCELLERPAPLPGEDRLPASR